MQTVSFAIIALFILAFGAVSRRIEGTLITAPMVFVGFGVLMSSQLNLSFGMALESPVIHFIAELTLILVLFTDASRIDLRQLIRHHTIPVRLLAIGLPLTMVAGAVVAAVTLGHLSFWEGAVVAVILAPTDAALGQAVVSSPLVPVRIRQALNVESGLNDGIALPVVLITVCLAAIGHEETAGYWLKFAALQVLLGPAVGMLVGYLGGKLVEWGKRSEWMSHSFQDLSALGLSLSSYALAELVGGNGFIAAFFCGLILGNTARGICSCLYEFAEAEGQLLGLITFMIFGAFMVPSAVAHAGGETVLYAILSLTVVRMIPVAVSLLGVGLQGRTVGFVGWFGPRGIASILFGLVVLEEAGLPAGEEIFEVVTLTVLFSVILHGLTAAPGSRWYSAHAERMRARGEAPECKAVPEMPTRL